MLKNFWVSKEIWEILVFDRFNDVKLFLNKAYVFEGKMIICNEGNIIEWMF